MVPSTCGVAWATGGRMLALFVKGGSSSGDITAPPVGTRRDNGCLTFVQS